MPTLELRPTHNLVQDSYPALRQCNELGATHQTRDKPGQQQ
jgi:hypothetical protein